jgi:hypothetical protein
MACSRVTCSTQGCVAQALSAEYRVCQGLRAAPLTASCRGYEFRADPVNPDLSRTWRAPPADPTVVPPLSLRCTSVLPPSLIGGTTEGQRRENGGTTEGERRDNGGRTEGQWRYQGVLGAAGWLAACGRVTSTPRLTAWGLHGRNNLCREGLWGASPHRHHVAVGVPPAGEIGILPPAGVWTLCGLSQSQSRRDCIIQPRVGRAERPTLGKRSS